MPITSDCFLDWCQSFNSGENLTEIDYRIIVSRSYYSAYHATLYFAESSLEIPISSYRGSLHLKLSEMLSNFTCEDKERQREIRRIGVRISALHTLRIRADYHLLDTLSLKDAEGLIKNTSEIIGIINGIKQSVAA